MYGTGFAEQFQSSAINRSFPIYSYSVIALKECKY